MRMPVDGIQAFIEIAELGSFQKAADKLFITQTGLSRRLQRLEAFVGLKLLDRTTRSTTLTSVGREFLPLATRLISDLTEGLDRLKTTARFSLGDVTIACLQSLAFRQLPSLLLKYAQQYPQNRVHILERTGSLVTEAVKQGQAELGIHIAQSEGSRDLLETPLARDPFMLFCERNHGLARKRRVKWTDLAGVDLITLGGASGNRRIIEERLALVGLPARGRFVVESTPTALAMASAGVGVAILPAAGNAGPLNQGVSSVPLVDPVVYRSISLIRHKGETLSPAAEALFLTISKGLSTEMTGC